MPRLTRPVPPRLVMFVSFALVSVTNYAFSLAAGWFLSPGDFGLLAFAQTLMTFGGLVVSSGFVWSLSAALLKAEGPHRQPLVRGAIAANLLLGLAVSAVILGLYAAGPLRPGLETWQIALLTALTLPFVSLIAAQRGAFQGIERFVPLAAMNVLEVTTKMVGGLLLVWLGFGAAGAVAGFVLGSALTMVVGLLLLRRTMDFRVVGSMTRLSMRTSGAMFGAILGLAFLIHIDLVALKLLHVGPRADIGFYQAAIVLANAPFYLSSAMIPVLFARAVQAQRLGRTAPVFGDGSRFVLTLLVPMEIALAVAAPFFMGVLFPAGYEAGAPALRILALGNGTLMLVALLVSMFQATGHAATAARTLLVIVGLEALAMLWLVPAWGLVGSATGFLVAAILAMAALGGQYARVVDAEQRRQGQRWLLRYTAALAAGGAVGLLALWLGHDPFMALLVCAPVYVVVVAALRLLPLPRLPFSRRTGSHSLITEKV